MPDYNTGDKTQQGYGEYGTVWGGLELNLKRQITIGLTTAEEEDVLGGFYLRIYDSLNNLEWVLRGNELPPGEYSVEAGE